MLKMVLCADLKLAPIPFHFIPYLTMLLLCPSLLCYCALSFPGYLSAAHPGADDFEVGEEYLVDGLM